MSRGANSRSCAAPIDCCRGRTGRQFISNIIPQTTAQSGESLESFPKLLTGYKLYYVDDISGQKFPFGFPMSASALKPINWLCNLFAVPDNDESQARWAATLADAQRRLGM